MKKVGVIGSTGSVGKSALRVVRNLQDKEEPFSVASLCAKSNIDLLEVQAKEFRPEIVAVWDEDKALELQKRLAKEKIRVVGGVEGVIAAATCPSADVILLAICGFDGVLPTLEAIKASKSVALANKEALVAAGSLVLELAKEKGVDLIPVDSELTALFQCLKGEDPKNVERLILTASGGPFWNLSDQELKGVLPKEALKHPNYKMGAKVSIDSSTMMNKGLEIIEAHYLFQIPKEKIDVVVHPQQIIHGMVEFSDRSIMAQMGDPDMAIPIQVALTHPKRLPFPMTPFDFTKTALSFFPWQEKKERFRCLELAYHSIEMGGSCACYLSGANEVVVDQFLKGKLSWIEIGQKLENLLENYTPRNVGCYEDLVEIDQEARSEAKELR